MTLLHRAATLTPPTLAVAVFGGLPVVGLLLWPNLAAATSGVRPETVTSVAWDAVLCFGPLALPLVGVGAVVVWLERNG